MIKKLRIKNFKAIQDSGTIKLGNLNVLIGNNGVGKSSLIEALEVWVKLVSGNAESAFADFKGFENTLNKAGSKIKTEVSEGIEEVLPYFHFEVSFVVGEYNFQQELDLGIWKERLVTLREDFKQEIGDKPIHNVYNGIRYTFLNRNGILESGIRKELDFKSYFHVNDQDLQFVRMNGFLMGEPRPLGITRHSQMSLKPDGSNLAEYLGNIQQTDLDVFAGIIESMNSFLLPFTQDLQVQFSSEIQKQAYLTLTENGSKIPGWMLSTGTLRLIGLMAVLRNPNAAAVVIIEEIENGLDPRTIGFIINEVKNYIARTGGQVIITTHSPYLLDLVPAKDVILVERGPKGPTFKRPKLNKDFIDWTKKFATGQLYTMGVLTDFTK